MIGQRLFNNKFLLFWTNFLLVEKKLSQAENREVLLKVKV
jgi:hypothetical protein